MSGKDYTGEPGAIGPVGEHGEQGPACDIASIPSRISIHELLFHSKWILTSKLFWLGVTNSLGASLVLIANSDLTKDHPKVIAGCWLAASILTAVLRVFTNQAVTIFPVPLNKPKLLPTSSEDGCGYWETKEIKETQKSAKPLSLSRMFTKLEIRPETRPETKPESRRSPDAPIDIDRFDR